MSGSHLAVIIMPIVIAVALTTWLCLVLYAANHPLRRRSGAPLRNEVAGGAFDAVEGGRQLMPIPEHRAMVARQADEAAGMPPATAAHAATERAAAERVRAAEATNAQAMVVQPPYQEVPEAPAAVVPPARRPAAVAGQPIPEQGRRVIIRRVAAGRGGQPSTQQAVKDVGRHLVGAARGVADIAAGLRHRH